MRRFLQHDFRDSHPGMGKTLLFGLLALVVAIAITGLFTTKAKAADKGGPNVFEEIVPKASTWSGCGLEGRAGWSTVSADSPIPVTTAAEGGKGGVGAFCDWQAGKWFVIGAFITHDWAMGDLSTLGINTDLSYGARVGFPLNKFVMPYAGGARSHVDVDGIGRVDGWKALAGLEVRLATETPLYFAVEASRGFYENVAGSGIDANSTDIMAKMIIRPFSK